MVHRLEAEAAKTNAEFEEHQRKEEALRVAETAAKTKDVALKD